MSKDPRLRKQQSSDPNNAFSFSPSSTLPTPATITPTESPTSATTAATVNSPLVSASSKSATSTTKSPGSPPTLNATTTASSTMTVPTFTSQPQSQKRSQSRARSQSRPRPQPAHPLLAAPGSQPYSQPRFNQQEPLIDTQRAKEEREYLQSKRSQNPYAASNNNPPPPPAQESQPPKSNGPPVQPGPPSRSQPQQSGYQGSTSMRPDFASIPGSSVGQRSKSRGRSPTVQSRQLLPPPPSHIRRPSADFQPSGPYHRPDQNAGTTQSSSSRNNSRQWDLPMPDPLSMTSSGMQGAPGGPTTPTTSTTPTTRGYRNPFEKFAESASGGSISAPPRPQYGQSGSYSGPYSGSYTRPYSGSYSGPLSGSYSGPPSRPPSRSNSGSYSGPPSRSNSGSYSGPPSRSNSGSYSGPPSGAYTGGRAPNSMAYRGSLTSDRDTPPSSLSSSSMEGERSRAPVSRNRSKSRGRPPGPPSSDSVRAPPSESAGPPSHERGRSKSVVRSKSQSHPRSPSRARSRARSRPRSRSRYRSLSRPARQNISMGTYERSYRSPSRSKHGRYDSESNSEFSDSDSGYYRRNRRNKRRRLYSSSEDSSSSLDDSDYSDDNVAEVDVNGAPTKSDTNGFTPAQRLNGPMSEIMLELKRLNRRYSELGEKQRRTQKKIRRITRDLASEIRELKRDFPAGPEELSGGADATRVAQTTRLYQRRSNSRSTPRSTPSSTPQPTPPLAQNAESGQQPGSAPRGRAELGAAEPSSSGARSFSRSRASTQNGGTVRGFADTNGQHPVPPPPSLIPASAGEAVKTEESLDESLSTIKRKRQRTTSDGQMPDPNAPSGGGGGSVRVGRSGSTMQNYATAPTRSIGNTRVFDQATYDLPIAKQQELSVISLGRSNAMERIGGGRGPRPLVLNPFARGTPYEKIAVVNGLDGLITLYDIDRQEKVMEITPKVSRVIPYAETLAWVSADTFVAVSHLKLGQSWEGVKENLERAKAEGKDVSESDPTRFSPPETQTNLISIYYNREGELKNRIFTIQGFPHDRPIQTVTAVASENNNMGYVTAGHDKRLVHWKFTRQDGGSYVGGGMADVHNLHTNTIVSAMYSHTTKRFYSGGLDGRYVVFDMEARKPVYFEKLGRIVHIVQNPADPRLQAVVFSEPTSTNPYQYQLLDERVPGQKVLSLDHRCKSTMSKFSTPSWHTEGGLFCSGTENDGLINIWDIRWTGIRLDDKTRPGTGCVTVDISEDGIKAARAMAPMRNVGDFDRKHPILWANNQRLKVAGRSSSARKCGPTQVVDVGGNKVAQALFHPTRDVVMIQNFDGALSFHDYKMITKLVD